MWAYGLKKVRTRTCSLPDGRPLTGKGLFLLPLVPTGRAVILGIIIQWPFGFWVPTSKMPKAPGQAHLPLWNRLLNT